MCIETLLLGNCDPNEFGRPEISPLTSALRIVDTGALCLLLSSNANPNLTARGDHLPIFAAIARQNLPAVQALVAPRANVQVRGCAMTPAHTRGAMNAPRWGGYTPLEMARGNVAITREVLAAGSDTVQERPGEWER